MTSGLNDALATFQHFINDMLRHFLEQFVVVYLGNILIFSDNRDQHTTHVCTVLERIQQHSLYTKLEKHALAQTSTEFLGFILSPELINMDPHKVQAVCD